MITVHEASELWQLDERRITNLCREGKIIGAKKEGKHWMIPANTPKPADGRLKLHEAIEVSETVTHYTQKGAYNNVVKAFEDTYLRLEE